MTESASVDGAVGGAAELHCDPSPSPACPATCSASLPPELAAEVSRWSRGNCQACQHNAQFYCPFCCVPVGVPDGVAVPKVILPFRRCEVIFSDQPKKATGIHAKVLSPAQVRLVDVFTNESCTNRTLSRNRPLEPARSELPDEMFPEVAVVTEIPEYDPETTLLLFPDEGSVPISEAGIDPAKLTLVVIDANWKIAQKLRKHKRLEGLRSVRLHTPPPSRFWRYHSEGAGCVSTIEALAAVIREMRPVAEEHEEQKSDLEEPILYFFARQYAVVEAKIALKFGGGAAVPMSDAWKEKRSARQRQKEQVKRLRPNGDAPAVNESSRP